MIMGEGDETRLKILLVHSGADLYGASRSALRLSMGLLSRGHEVRLLIPGRGPLHDAACECDVPVRVLDLPLIERQRFGNIFRALAVALQVPGSVLRLVRYIRSERYSIVHSNTATLFTPALAARLAGVPHVWHVRETFGEFPRLWKVFRRYITHLADRIVCVSRAVADQFPLVCSGQVVVIHNGLPLREFEEPADGSRFREDHDLVDRILIGVVGRIKLRRKGQEIFVRAAARLKDRWPDVRFLIIGAPFPGNERHLANLEREIHDLGVERSVVFTGESTDMKPVLQALDVVVLPSVDPEPFSGVIVEAMAMGKPVVGTWSGGTPEQIIDGQTGFLVPPGDPVALAERIEVLLADPQLRNRMGRAARDRFERALEFDRFFSKMHRIYRGITAEPRS